MTRGFDDLILSFMKQNYVTKTKLQKPYQNNVNKFLNPIWIWGQNNNRQIEDQTERKK